MLVTFKSKASADVIMFGEQAARLIELLGKGTDSTAKGIVTVEQLPGAIAALQAAIAEGQLPKPRRSIRFLLPPEIYGTFAENDSGIPPADVEKFAEALTAAGITNDIHVYDDVGHGFWLRVDEDRAVREAPATDAWNRLKRFLSRVLG